MGVGGGDGRREGKGKGEEGAGIRYTRGPAFRQRRKRGEGTGSLVICSL